MNEPLSLDDHLPDNLRIPPHSQEAEQAVLGGLLLNNEAWDEVAERVGPKDFYRKEHRLIFQVVDQLVEEEKPCDLVTVSQALTHRGELDDVGGMTYLSDLARNTPSAANINAYADIVRERSILRQLIQVSHGIAEQSFNPKGTPSLEILDAAESAIFEIAEQQKKGSGPQDIKTVLKKAVDRIDELYKNKNSLTGLTTGFEELDKMTSGLQPSDMVVVAGRPSMGKTTFAMNLCENVALKAHKPVLVFSMEMPADAIVMRMLSSLGRINQTSIRSGRLDQDDWPRITSAIQMLSEQKFFIDDTPALSPLELRTRARRVARECGGQLGMIMIDYLQLMQVPGADSRVNEISEISRSLKGLAKELNCPVVALSQLNRSLEQRPNKRPVMSDLRESGAIEQDADVIMFLYRDEVYNQDTTEKGIGEVIIGKQRNGPIGTVRVAFRGEYLRFDDLAPEYYQQYAGDE
ncbi:MAG: replicative DNA helicase [Alcanivorax sp.]|jgi:replicative DNA helicase|uniref:Replicative DNA helicase n=3 Tax=Alloalcanivorax venustensis TaxID=172371 RepID=A0ABS0AJY6_9GAMM|nr:replicative DNA helicase [Alloalcanivorax venustensis]KXJ47209.1 MAG: replicative DNA helicase [Alcanivorax sp. Nap_24]MAD71164.1 replicative DNA helicase [Alcanivorax sp.]MEA3260932.1 replicative DNA helicase [Pseudomonadota bacterium]MAK23511.1 replicative DNA helicase [Alcanivorax sp.]MAQ35445.1 replicative DNA helicase [Alcanivorax sp.]|tara:strand:+ start:64090 stop:65481 length:1392 start_codon:yes stop_codon:yes gene_type:complete